jgi:murein DD-endopeptidase MepM/ murein hydrolase activator NlpD
LSGRGPDPSSRRRSRPDRLGPPRQVDSCGGLVGVAGPDLGGPASTTDLEGILARSTGKVGSIGSAFLRVAGPFPVAGPARWTNDWHARRCEPYPHLHQGLDIFAEGGTPVVAARDGRISQRADHAIAGLSVEITGGDGVQYFYAHLSQIAEGVSVGDRVETGDVLGYIGATGNAFGGPPHLHLEIQPGGVPVPPKPYVDRWLAISERRARGMVRAAWAVVGVTRPNEGVTPAVQGIPTLMGAWPTPALRPSWHPTIRLLTVSAVGAGIPLWVVLSWRAARRRRIAWRQLTQAVRISAGRKERVLAGSL